jgi:hypothetical protein
MDSRWFAEDRKLPKAEQAQAKLETEKALKAATLLSRRLKQILQDEVEKTYTKEEDYEGIGWEFQVTKLFARRQTLNEIINLIP